MRVTIVNIVVGLIAATTAACNSSTQVDARAARARELLGDMPNSPSSDDEIVEFFTDGTEEAPLGQTVKDTELSLGQNSTLGLSSTRCHVPAGTVVRKIGLTRQKRLFVALLKPCESSFQVEDSESAKAVGVAAQPGETLSARISEGYLLVSDVGTLEASSIGADGTKDEETKGTLEAGGQSAQICKVDIRRGNDFSQPRKNMIPVAIPAQLFSNGNRRGGPSGISLVVSSLPAGAKRLKVELVADGMINGLVNNRPVSAKICDRKNFPVNSNFATLCADRENKQPKMTRDVPLTQLKTWGGGTYSDDFFNYVDRPNSWQGLTFSIRASVDGKECESATASSRLPPVQLIDPLVLDFSKSQSLATIDVLDSKTEFEFTGQGLKVQTGWIAADQALLVQDLDGNSKIDSGRELFGDGTIMKSGALAAHGFLALQDLDSNKDGAFTAEDRDWKRVKLWFDKDQDGKTQSGELVTLESQSVTKIDLKFRSTSVLPSLTRTTITNNVPYTSRFFGPSICPKSGCLIGDVFFGTFSADQQLAGGW